MRTFSGSERNSEKRRSEPQNLRRRYIGNPHCMQADFFVSDHAVREKKTALRKSGAFLFWAAGSLQMRRKEAGRYKETESRISGRCLLLCPIDHTAVHTAEYSGSFARVN